MYDFNIREAFHASILKQAHACENTMVLDELGLMNGKYRADIAVLNGKLEGFEIKGDRDTLDRLENQSKAYSEIFQKASIVTCEKYIGKCVEMLPDWWGIYLVSETKSGRIKIKAERRSELNKDMNPYAIAQLLWRDEAIELVLEELDLEIPKRITRAQLYRLLSENMEIQALSKFVIKKLKNRQGWREGHSTL